MTLPTRRTFLASAAALAAVPSLLRAQAARPVSREIFGKTPEGVEVERFTLTNTRGLEARIMTLGATLITLKAPDKDGRADIVTLYLDTLEDYFKGHPLFGSVVGRYANRIGNAKFTIEGKEYDIARNSGKHHIHGGNKEAFHRVVWKVAKVLDDGVELTHTSADGDAGFPGTVQATVTYRLTADNELVMKYRATTDKPTHVNLTNHAYWNLAGAGSGDVLAHELTLNADQYLAMGADKIPTGELLAVKDTAMDFTRPMSVGSRIDKVDGKNYDHCYVLRKGADFSARVVDPKSGRVMIVKTDQPGVQIFTASFLSDRYKGGGKPYGPYHGLCLETQAYPDSPNKPAFPTTLLRPGEVYERTTTHRFEVAR